MSRILVAISLIGFLSFTSSDSTVAIDYYSPENIWKFAEYLYSEKDYLRAVEEYQKYISIEPSESEKALYKIGLCHRLSGNPDKSIDYFHRIAIQPNSRLRSSALYQIAYTYYILSQHNASIKYLDQILDETTDEEEKTLILKTLNYLSQKMWLSANDTLKLIDKASNDEYIYSLQAITQEGMRLRNKSPVVAGILSGFLPGAGKAYCRQYGDGVFSFALVTLVGLLAWSGFREDGIRSIKGWISGGAGIVFYMGNIYGSSFAARIYNNNQAKELMKRLPELPTE